MYKRKNRFIFAAAFGGMVPWAYGSSLTYCGDAEPMAIGLGSVETTRERVRKRGPWAWDRALGRRRVDIYEPTMKSLILAQDER